MIETIKNSWKIIAALVTVAAVGYGARWFHTHHCCKDHTCGPSLKRGECPRRSCPKEQEE